jgi:hypothetical protein
MGLNKKRLARTRRNARDRRIRRLGVPLLDTEDREAEEIPILRVEEPSPRRRSRDPERDARLTEILVGECKTAAIQVLGTKRQPEFWWGGRLRREKLYRHVGAHLPPAARQLLKRSQLGWHTVRKLAEVDEDMKYWYLDDARREKNRRTAARDGLLARYLNGQ